MPSVAFLRLLFGFDAAILTDAQKDETVNGHLDGEVEFTLDDWRVTQGDVVGKEITPAFDFSEELIIHLGGATFALDL